MYNLNWNGRHLLGEDLGPLSIKELQQLERQLEVALTHVRSRKVCLNINLNVLYTS